MGGPGPNPRNLPVAVRPLVLAVFCLALWAVMQAVARLESPRDRIHPPSLEASPAELLRHSPGRFADQPGVPVSLTGFRRLAGVAGRCSSPAIPAPLMGFGSSQLLLRPDSSVRVLRDGCPRVVDVEHHRPRLIFVGAPAARPNQTLSGDSRHCAADGDVFSARLLGFDPSVPAVCRRSIRRKLCCPGLCLFRVFRTVHGCSVAGSSPPHSPAVACSASGGSPLLSLACRAGRPAGTPLVRRDPGQPHAACSSAIPGGRCLAPPITAWRFVPCRTSNPYEVFHLLMKHPMHSLA